MLKRISKQMLLKCLIKSFRSALSSTGLLLLILVAVSVFRGYPFKYSYYVSIGYLIVLTFIKMISVYKEFNPKLYTISLDKDKEFLEREPELKELITELSKRNNKGKNVQPINK